MKALEITDIHKTYRSGKREIRAVDGVSLIVEEGEIFGLLGMNGAGKSTTIKICTGVTAPDGGAVSVFGHAVASVEARRLMNVSPQETAVAPLLSVKENLVLIARLYGADKDEAASAALSTAERLGLTDRLSDRAGKLSGGLMRRLSVGMAVVTNPKLIFLDEPTLGLDIVARRELWRYIREIRKSAAIILTTHYLEEAEALCDRIAIMAKGKIVAIGSPSELIEKSGKDNFEDAFLALSGEENYE